MHIVNRRVILEYADTQVHFPFMLEHDDGCWYMTYREGPHAEPGGDRMHCVLSADRGDSWLPWSGLTPEPLLRFFRTRLIDGGWLSHRYLLEGASTAIILRSSDGIRWQRTAAALTGLPYNAESVCCLWGHIIELPDGSLRCGIYGEKGELPRFNHGIRFLAGVIASDDGGASWRYQANLCDDQSPGNEGPCEMDLCRLASGELLAVMRTGMSPSSHLLQVRSDDDGQTWSSPIDLGLPGVSPQLLLLDNGVLICAFGTRDIQVMCDVSGTGHHWSAPLPIYRGQGSGYTDVQALGADTFRLVYDESSFFEEHAGGHRIVRVVLQALKTESDHPLPDR